MERWASRDTDVAIILNGRQQDNISALTEIWSKCSLKVAADGGANFVYDKLGDGENVLPDLITGDMDSIRDGVMSFYKDKGIPIRHTPDQDETDFVKCLRVVVAEIADRKLVVERIVVFGAYGGRLDQVFANINALIVACGLTDIPVYLLDDTQEARLLPKGHHCISISQPEIIDWCGLVPVIQPVTTSTSGLKWNLDKEKMMYGGVISTSNKVTGTKVNVECDGPLLFMIGY